METILTRIIQHIETISRFTSSPENGCTRLSYSAEDREAKHYLIGEFEKIGMTVDTDSVGNLRFRNNREREGKPVVIIGSHIDTVPNGGKYDGVVGVVGGLEVAQCLYEAGIELPFALEVMVFAEEEGSNFGSTMLGSKAMIGKFPGPEAFRSYTNKDGVTWYEVMRSYGLDPEAMEFPLLIPSKVLAMFELHIEQGIVLERQQRKLGIVETIAGMMTFEIVVTGQSNHAGSTPMSMRKDPMAGAGELVLAIEQIAREQPGPHTVATVGRITAKPGASNVIPERVICSLDVRDVSDGNILKAVGNIKERAALIADKRGLSIEFHLVGKSQAAPLSKKVVDMLVQQAQAMGIPFLRMHSGAVHDAAMIAEQCDVGMVFVPSRNGLSHTSAEFTAYDDIKMGCDLLLNTILKIPQGGLT